MFAIGLLGFGVLLLEQVDYVDRFIDTMNHKRVILERRIMTAYTKFMVTFECLSQHLSYTNTRSFYADVYNHSFDHEYIISTRQIVKTSVSVRPDTFKVNLRAFSTQVSATPDIRKHIAPPMDEDVDTIIKRRFGFV